MIIKKQEISSYETEKVAEQASKDATWWETKMTQKG